MSNKNSGEPVSTLHTQGPWKAFNEYGAIEVQDARGSAIVHWAGFDASDLPPSVRFANAKRIVQCVNSHDALVAALREFIDREYNPFEPNNQSARYRRLKALDTALAATRSSDTDGAPLPERTGCSAGKDEECTARYCGKPGVCRDPIATPGLSGSSDTGNTEGTPDAQTRRADIARHGFPLNIDGHKYRWPQHRISAREICELVSIPSDYGVWQASTEPTDPPVETADLDNAMGYALPTFFTGRRVTTAGSASECAAETIATNSDVLSQHQRTLDAEGGRVADLSKHRGDGPSTDGMYPGESVAEAARAWAGWCDHRSMSGLTLFLRKVAALAAGVPVAAKTGDAAQPDVTELAKEAVNALATVHYDHMGGTHADVERCFEAAKALYAALHPDGVKGTAPETESGEPLIQPPFRSPHE